MSKDNINLIKINPKDVAVRKGFNTREDYGDLKELMASMRSGFDPAHPIVVTKDLASEGKYVLGSQGHRRLEVARMLQDDKELPGNFVYAVLEPEDLSDIDRNLDIVRKNTGEPLSFLAKARVIQRHKEANTDDSNRDIAKALGMSSTNVDDSLMLVGCATKATLDYVAKGKVTAYIVVQLLKEHKRDGEKVEEAVEELLEDAKREGKDKAKKPKKKEDVEKETAAEAKAREAAAAQEKADNEARKARLKELQNTEKRVVKLAAETAEVIVKINAAIKDKPDEVSEFDKLMGDLQVTIGAFVAGKGLDIERNLVDVSDKVEATKIGDVWASVRAVVKCHDQTVKDMAKEMDEAVKAAEKAGKDALANVLNAGKEAAKAAKEAAKA